MPAAAAMSMFVSSVLLVLALRSPRVHAALILVTDSGQSGNEGVTFSPRMDFEQWKPLTGRGDPLRNDPTYDYEPPLLDKVHYWADEPRLNSQRHPERKSEVLMLGVSSRKPSVTPRAPLQAPRRHVYRPPPKKYEDFTYKLSDHYLMTILVPPPPPPPPPIHQPPLLGIPDNKIPVEMNVPLQTASAIPTTIPLVESTALPEHLSSFYALQKSNLIYQSSSTQSLISNKTKPVVHNAVSGDYAGWEPTTPIDDNDYTNDTLNIIPNDHLEVSQNPYAFYKPMLSEVPPPPNTISSAVTSAFLPTALPPTPALEMTTAFTQVTVTPEAVTEVPDVTTDIPQQVTTEKSNTVLWQQTPVTTSVPKTDTSVMDMLRPMMSMPLINGPNKQEDSLYAYASENIQIFDKHNIENIQIKTMQTMQPPPQTKQAESSPVSQKQHFYVNSLASNRNPAIYTHGPYLHGRFTTPIPTTVDDYTDSGKSITEMSTTPHYLIIQGHSKVKTYGSKPKVPASQETISNEITKPTVTDEVKHLHTKKSATKLDTTDVNRKSRSKNLKSLIEKGLGSIEIQEADIGIKYDVSDGSDVPVEIYRKGIVEPDVISSLSANGGHVRIKRQIDLEDLLPFDEDDIEEYVYKFLENKKNETSITGLIAQAVTSDAAAAVDELEDDADILDEER